MTDRGVSETLGFVFIFALIISSVGIVYTVGISGLEDVRSAERVTNAERAFDVLGHNFEDMVYRGAPGRATEIKLADAQLYMDDSIVVNVSGHVEGDPNTNFSTIETKIEPIIYRAGDSKIVYTNGAIIRQDGDASVMTREPDLLIESNRSTLPIVQTRADESENIGGSTVVLVRADKSGEELAFTNQSETWDVWFNVTTPRTDAWERHLDAKPGTDCTVNDETVSCEYTVNRLHVVIYQIKVQITD
ncbi:MAG: hypothetical protein ABEH65_08440 [Halobacteriales archaeon]